MTVTTADVDLLRAFAEAPEEEGAGLWKSEFEQVLSNIADTCILHHPWSIVRNLIKYRIQSNVANESTTDTDHGETLQDYLLRINRALDALEEAPFTIQRLCELAIRPNEHHKSVWKYMRALEKVLLVTTMEDIKHIQLIELEEATPMEIVTKHNQPTETAEQAVSTASNGAALSTEPVSAPPPTPICSNGTSEPKELDSSPMDTD
ncbi:PPP4R2-domain-containing protein [Gaertneriomyces semiglobifer]|nr:PPP4R2-domain-containing protein [Gaertneriomyces semiglobifer]